MSNRRWNIKATPGEKPGVALRFKKQKSGKQDSNLRPPGPKPGALPS